MDTLIGDVLVPLAMIGLMFGMGLTLTLEDFRRIAANPRATIIGTLLQLVGMPLVGIALALAFDLPLLLAAGLVVIAACPGGMFSNMYVHLARAHTALSITLTASATMVTLFTLPLWTNWILSRIDGGATGVQMPVLRTALELGGLTVLPVLVGMFVRRRRPQWARLDSWLAPGGALVIIGGMVYDGAQRSELPIREAELSLVPTLLLAAAAIVLGLIVPALARLPIRDTVTVSVELIVKNVLLGIVIAQRSLDFEAVIPIFVFSIFQTPAGILILVAWRLLARAGIVEPAPSRAETALGN
jgi:BASS family bile acid:Na+ symporter